MKSKKNIVLMIIFIMIALASQVQAITYTGSLMYSGGGIIASDGWQNSSTVFSWTVASVGEVDGYILWQYDYTFTVPIKNISHFIIEISPDALTGDFNFLDMVGVVDDYSAGGSNPNMPGSMRGIKFGPDGLSLSISFETTRAPVWGDFYAKDGSSGGVWVTAWNEGFLDDDPTNDPSNGSIDNHVLRPDTGQTQVPEPSTLLLIGFGLLGVAGISRMIRK